MERWWPSNPWRGISIGERWRLARLSASGERIDDPNDAQLVHAYLEYWEWFNGTVGWRFINKVGPFLVLPALSVGLVLYAALDGDVWLSLLGVALIAGYVLSIRSVGSRLRRFHRTAEANGWNDLG